MTTKIPALSTYTTRVSRRLPALDRGGDYLLQIDIFGCRVNENPGFPSYDQLILHSGVAEQGALSLLITPLGEIKLSDIVHLAFQTTGGQGITPYYTQRTAKAIWLVFEPGKPKMSTYTQLKVSAYIKGRDQGRPLGIGDDKSSAGDSSATPMEIDSLIADFEDQGGRVATIDHERPQSPAAQLEIMWY